MDKHNPSNSERCSFTAELVIFGVLKLPKVRYVQKTGEVVYQTTFRWHIYSAIFVPKITGIGQLLLKLSLVVGWYPFFETQCRFRLGYTSRARNVIMNRQMATEACNYAESRVFYR